MNERIEKLADEAVKGLSGALNIPDEFCEKFAELIVRECVSIVSSSSLPDAYSEPCLLDIANEIKEHFGIEK